MLHIGTGNQHQTYVMRARDLEATSMEKDLGALMDKDLKFRKHAAAVIAKASKSMGVIKKYFQELDYDV